MTIRNVTIGDKFKNGKHIICEVVDFVELKSMTTGKVFDCICYARGVNTLSTNSFEVPFSMVVRNRIK